MRLFTTALAAAVTAATLAPVAHAGGPALATEIVASGLSSPTYVAAAPGDDTRLFIIQQNGVIRLMKDGVLLPAPFLDLNSIVPNETYNGLLGIAFHPDYETNGYFYVQHPRGSSSSSNRITVARYQVSADPDLADAGSREEIYVESFPNSPGHHVGGWIGFGNDGFLYMGLGDGHTSGGESAGGARSQSLSSPWGKLHRMDVNGDDFPGDVDHDYAIPADNPFVGAGGLESVYARGLRNPYRADIDRANGDIWIADVGLHAREEIDLIPGDSGGGQNFGWNCAEGTICTTNSNCNCVSDGLVEPIYEYTHSLGCSVSGGAIYRGCAVPGLEGTYFYGDWCSRRIWSLRYEGGVVGDAQERTSELDPPGAVSFGAILAVAPGPRGELYITDTSRVYRIIPAGGIVDDNGNGIADACEVPGDLNGDGHVTFADLIALLGTWGVCPVPCPPCLGDFDGDCTVGFGDLITLLANWG